MSGRHRVVKPRRRFGLAAVRVPVRALARWVRAGRAAVARSWARLVERAKARFDVEDPWADVHLADDPQSTSPDPLPAPAPPEVEESEPEPVALTPEQVLPVLHTQHPHLPLVHVLWHVNERGVSGEVNALDADTPERRRIVGLFADALAAPIEEDQDDEHFTVYVTSEIGTVPFTVAAVIPHDDTIPLRVYRESASAQETQALPAELVEEVLSR